MTFANTQVSHAQTHTCNYTNGQRAAAQPPEHDVELTTNAGAEERRSSRSHLHVSAVIHDLFFLIRETGRVCLDHLGEEGVKKKKKAPCLFHCTRKLFISSFAFSSLFVSALRIKEFLCSHLCVCVCVCVCVCPVDSWLQ